MSDSRDKPWSNNPNALHISSEDYRLEKYAFAGYFIATISYGIAVALFFQSMYALISPAKPMKKGTKWALIVHTAVMFTLLTIPHATLFLIICLANNQGSLGADDHIPTTLVLKATTIFAVTFTLNQWLADGLLLYRCYVVYSMNPWAMALPCLIHIASVATDILYIRRETTESSSLISTMLGYSYLLIWPMLKFLLTLMIVIRLFLHRRNFRKAIGVSDESSGLYTAVVVMLIESCALCTVPYLLFIIPPGQESCVFFIALAPIQVIASYMIIVRVARRRALTSESISGSAESIRFGSQGTTAEGEGLLPDEDPTNATEVNGEAPSKLGAGAEGAIEEVPL